MNRLPRTLPEGWRVVVTSVPDIADGPPVVKSVKPMLPLVSNDMYETQRTDWHLDVRNDTDDT